MIRKKSPMGDLSARSGRFLDGLSDNDRPFSEKVWSRRKQLTANGMSAAAAVASGALNGTWTGILPAQSMARSPSPDDANEDLDDGSQDAEGVWSADIEQSFQEAIHIYPPCGRRKIILSDEGKMYGRNELIARYIKLRTGKTRTRKQVSSHIQVLARRKSKEFQTQLKITDHAVRERAMQHLGTLSSAQIVSMTCNNGGATVAPATGPANGGPAAVALPNINGSLQGPLAAFNAAAVASAWPAVSGADSYRLAAVAASLNTHGTPLQTSPHLPAVGNGDVHTGDKINGLDLAVVALSAFVEWPRTSGAPSPAPLVKLEGNSETLQQQTCRHVFVQVAQNQSAPITEVIQIDQIYDKFPPLFTELTRTGPLDAFFLMKFWANVKYPAELERFEPSTAKRETADDGHSQPFYGVECILESSQSRPIQCLTTMCSFGESAVEKTEEVKPMVENGRFIYNTHQQPMCDYMVSFIRRLKDLTGPSEMNSVLEHFTILQVFKDAGTGQVLLCLGYMFAVDDKLDKTDQSQYNVYRLTNCVAPSLDGNGSPVDMDL